MQQKQLSSPTLPLWKKALSLLLLILLALGTYYTYQGQFILVLSYLAGFFFIAGIGLLIAYTYSIELFLWFIGKKSEYRKLYDTAQQATKGIVNAAIQYLPSDLEQDEKDRLKADVPTYIQLRFMADINGLIMRAFVGAFAAAFALLGTIVLMKQNERIDVQNEKINIQTHLMESERRGSQVVLMNNVLEDLSAEIREEKKNGKTDSTGYTLSRPLIGRISATSQGFLPYRFLEEGKLTEKEYSVERGQLLLAILNSRIDSASMVRINSASSFKGAYLKKFRLDEANLRGADLRGANLRGANLLFADLSEADLSGADLSGANLSGASLRLTSLARTDLRGAHMCLADLSGAYLEGANLHGVILMRANLELASLMGVNLSEMVTLYDTQGLPDSLKQKLQEAKPCLFTLPGCQEQFIPYSQ